MRFRAAFVVLLGLLCCNFGPGQVQYTSPNALGQIFYNANGTYSASNLPCWGVNTHTSNSTGSIPAGGNAGAPGNAYLIGVLGATCAVRADASDWDQVELSLGVYTYTASDAFWNTICAAGQHPVFLATYNNALYSSGVFTIIAAGANATGYNNYNVAFVNRLVNTNGCTGLYDEEFNEWNLTLWTGSQWNGTAYAPVLAGAANAVVAAQPSAKVISGGVTPGSYPPNQSIGQMISGGSSFGNVTYYGTHPYNYVVGTPTLTLPPEQILFDVNSLLLNADATVGGAAQKKNAAITEYGFPWDSLSNSVTQAMLNLQGVYMGEAALDTIIGGYAMYVPYELIDDGTNYNTNDGNSFGMFFNGSASSGSPITGATAYGIKPSGTAYQEVIGCTANTQPYTLSFNTANNVETATFPKSTGKCFAIYTFDATSSKSYSNTIGTFSSVTCKDLLGNSYALTYSGGVLSGTIAYYSGSSGTGPAICTAVN